MRQRPLLHFWCWLIGFLSLGLGSGTPAAPDDWKYDVVVLKDGQKTYRGLLIDYKDNAPLIEMRVVIRRPGERTRIENHVFERREIDTVERLTDGERAKLEARVRALDITGKELAERIRTLELQRIPWNRHGNSKGFRYEGGHFILESNLEEAMFRRVAVRLAQITNAYARYLPPRLEGTTSPTILLAGTLADYQALLRDRGHAFFNPAYYDPSRNEIVCGSDLARISAQLGHTRTEHASLRAELNRREAELSRLYKGKIPRESLRPILEARTQIDATEKANERLYQDATHQLFQRLQHEAFHAYLGSFVYRPGEAELPRWLNEGLAQIFETALIEAEEVRIGHADPERLKRAQTALSMGEFPSLTELLRSGAKHFVVAHSSDRVLSDRYYLAAWALATYLAFEHKVLGSPALEEYARATSRKVDPVEAFLILMGRETSRLPQFERDFRVYVQHLRPNGTVSRPR